MVYRCILSPWAAEESPDLRRVVEGELSSEQLSELNALGYNIYFLPNYPSVYNSTVTVDGSHIDKFEYVFADMDLKDGKHPNKETFITKVRELGCSSAVDSGNGIHAYWEVKDLDAMSFLRLQRRMMRYLDTDEAVCKIYQLMRMPGTDNTKAKGEYKKCTVVYSADAVYTCEDLDKLLPPITKADEEYCKQHYDKTYRVGPEVKVDVKLPLKFGQLLKSNEEVKKIWVGDVEDRSTSDFRIGHIMFASGFTKDEAMSVLVNCAKAMERAPSHRINYALNIVEKIWTYELEQDTAAPLSESVKDILSRPIEGLKGTRFRCWRYLDSTHHGFRLGQVIGLVAGSGVGKTAMALNMFKGFVQSNPDYTHFFIPLEQPANEIADRWRTMCGDETTLHDKVHVLSNYGADGSYRNLSFAEIKDYLLKFQKSTGKKIGCVVIDHIGALKKKTKDGENQGLMDVCHEMKAFAIETNTMLVMQSQAPREKAGIGDLELNKDAAYGTVYFESYCDYLITIWQPLKRMYLNDACPTVTAFKFCKIRHKKKGLDEIQEDVPYRLYFDWRNEQLRELTQKEEHSFDFFNKQCVNARKLDRKTDIIPYQSMPWAKKEAQSGKVDSNSDTGAA